jgi:hypothetical protein
LCDFDWNFDDVPDPELVACCYWEYARESVFIRDVKRRCLSPKWKEMFNGEYWEYCGNDIERIQSIGYAADVFVRSFFFDEMNDDRPHNPEAPRITDSFPLPWQSLSKGERKERSPIGNDATKIPLQPFARGHWSDARFLVEVAEKKIQHIRETENEVHQKYPGVSEYYLRKKGLLKSPDIGCSVFWDGGKESTIVEVQWENFTNEQIIRDFRKWVKINRPKDMPAPNKQGHKPKDWRANLVRLAVMRILSRFTPAEVVDPRRNRLPAIWKTKQFAGLKWGDVTKWHDARREAGKLFSKLFPFLPPGEKPLSWIRQPPGK